MKIEVLGSGCKKCEDLYQNVVEAARISCLEKNIEISKVADVNYFFKLGVFTTPALVIDEEVVSTAMVLTAKEIISFFKQKNIIA